MTYATNDITILDMATNEQVPSDIFLAAQPEAIADALAVAVNQIATTHALRGPRSKPMGIGRWTYEITDANGALRTYYLSTPEGLAFKPTFPKTVERHTHEDGSQSGIAVIESGPFAGTKMHFARAGADNPREDNGYSSNTLIEEPKKSR